MTLFVSENLSPFNQRLAWKYRELRRASKIHNAFSLKGVVKIHSTMNEQPISIEQIVPVTCVKILHNVLILFSKFKVTCGWCCGFFHSK